MAQMNYLTQCTFDFGALEQTPRILKNSGVRLVDRSWAESGLLTGRWPP